MARAVRILFRITFNTCVEVSPHTKKAQLKLEFYWVSAVLWYTADNFDLTSSQCARLGVNCFSCTKKTQSALAGFWNFASEHGSSTPQPIPSCHRLRFSRLSDPNDFSLASLYGRSTRPPPLTRWFAVLQFYTVLHSFTVGCFNTSESVVLPSSCLHVLHFFFNWCHINKAVINKERQ